MLCGYTDKISVRGGDDLDLMVSTDRANFTVDVVRLLHGDPNPEGPGYQEEKMDWVARGPYPAFVQELHLGSYGSLPPPRERLGDFTFACWICPTSPTPRKQVILSWGEEPLLRMELRINEQWGLVATVSENGQHKESIELSERVFPWRWQFVGLTLDVSRGELGVFGNQRGAFGPVVNRVQVPARKIFHSDQPMLLGASYQGGRPCPGFNGKIGRPLLLARYLDDIELCQLQLGIKPEGDGVCLGEWDLSRDISTDKMVDISGRDRHGKLHNAPARGVTGPLWTGPREKIYSDAPQEYDAVHFHDDDLADAGWKPSLKVHVPPDARSGIYAARLQSEGEPPWWLTFVVGDGGKKKAPILYIVPTLTWQAYGNSGRPEDEKRFGPSLYAAHSDGTSPYYLSLLKPISTLDPTYYQPPNLSSEVPETQCCHLVMADLYTIHWLEHVGVAYDVISDHDFHQLGAKALEPYSLVVCSGHHEYWTERMLNGFETYLEQDRSRVMFMSGNGLYWVTSIDPARPWLIEVRRGGGTGTSEADPGEIQHSSDSMRGGTWRSVGRAPQRLVGIGFAGTGVIRGSGFRRLEGSLNSRAAFIFEGIDKDEIIGDFGLNQGGAAGFEVDRVDFSLGSPEETLLLASSCDLPPSFIGTNEEGLGRAPKDPRVRADMVLLKKSSGSEIFSVGSITWTGSLSHKSYNNNVAKISTNVLKEFSR